MYGENNRNNRNFDVDDMANLVRWKTKKSFVYEIIIGIQVVVSILET